MSYFYSVLLFTNIACILGAIKFNGHFWLLIFSCCGAGVCLVQLLNI